MNLFSNIQEKPEIAKEFDETWWNVLGDYICNNERFDRLLIDIDEWRKEKIIYPEDKDVFKIFKLLPVNKVKVVIVGQDPYFNGNADGIAFSCKETLSPSLRQILFAIYKDLGISTKGVKPHLNLEYLVEQGVFLYNPILTVQQDKPLSHAGFGWEDFSKEVFKAINKVDNVVWLLWGAKARDYNSCSYNLTHQVMYAEHPAAAARDNRIWQVNHFSETNKYLKLKEKEEIKWVNQNQ